MNWSTSIRQVHRWTSIVFTATVVMNVVVMSLGDGEPPNWVVYSPLAPLFLLLATGLFMFVSPYVSASRPGRRTV